MTFAAHMQNLLTTTINTGDILLDKWSGLESTFMLSSLQEDLVKLRACRPRFRRLSEDHAEFIAKVYLTTATPNKIRETATLYRGIFLKAYADQYRSLSHIPSLLEVEDDQFSMAALKRYAEVQAVISFAPNIDLLIENHPHKS